ncbi:hypothetical protein [Desulfovibrio sp. SGI.169]|uniref:hypothetical protein n=1 Tax=Desulfovibrio sp. SGI.169 TaxID=3420561 RepID=UPI003CFC11D3
MNNIDLSPEALSRLKTLAQKATPGPWKSDVDGFGVYVDYEPVVERTYGYGCRNDFVCDLNDGEYHEYVDEKEQAATASYIAALHPGMVLAMCEEIERLRNMRLDQVAEVAISLATDAVSAAMGEDIKPIKLGTVCPYCGYESKSIEDAKAHDGTCPKHPAVIRAARLEKEADWLAREISSWEHDQLDGTDKHIREVPELREAARKAVEENND